MAYWKSLIILKEIKKAANFWAFGGTIYDLKFLRKFSNLDIKISGENWFFTNFLSHPPAILSFYTPLEHNNIFGLYRE